MQFHNAERSRVRGKHIIPTGDLSQTLPGFKGRLAGIWGEHDVTAGPYLDERREKLEQFKPGATFDVIPGAGHWVQYEAPDAFNRLLRTAVERRVSVTRPSRSAATGSPPRRRPRTRRSPAWPGVAATHVS